MFDIEELLNKNNKYKNAILQKRFKSKKNSVGYVILNNKPRVLKWYAPGFKKNMDTEYNILQKGVSILNIPNLIEIDREYNVIIMSYIVGKNLCDVINDTIMPRELKKKYVLGLAEWFATFHKHFSNNDRFIIRGDSILRNFIVTDRIWGVDFEESRAGNPTEDIGSICSSILSTDPMFTNEKFLLCKWFIKSYKIYVKWNVNNINNEIANALLERIQWMPEQENLLRDYSKIIRVQGLK
jgi:tRNA A-37 threonylcarbamoyl transferase component Bud32